MLVKVLCKDYVDDPKAMLDEADSAKCNTMLRSFLSKNVVDSDRVNVGYKLPMSAEKSLNN